MSDDDEDDDDEDEDDDEDDSENVGPSLLFRFVEFLRFVLI